MIKKNKKIENAINNIYEEIKSCDYDTKFNWDKLAKMTKILSIKKEDLYYILGKVNLLLMQFDQKCLITIHGFGKRIINPKEHDLLAKKTAKKAVKQYKKAGAIISSTNLNELNEEEQKNIIESANKYHTLEMFTSEILKKKKIGTYNKIDSRSAGLIMDTMKFFSDGK